MASETPSRSKITIRVWAPIFEALVARTDAAFVRRDQLISHTLQLEIPRIRAELPHRNSSRARRYMEARLRALFATGAGAKQLSLSVTPSVARELESLCADLNIPRESLLNRLFMFLGASGRFLADCFFDLTPDPLTDSGFLPDDSRDDMTPREALPTSLVTTTWLREGTFDVRGLALDLTRADPSSADYDKALSPLGRLVAVVDDPLRWYRWMLQMRLEQLLVHFRETGGIDVAQGLEKDRWMFTPFGYPFDEEELDGLNCCTPDGMLDRTPLAFSQTPVSQSAMPAAGAGSHAAAGRDK